MHLLLSCFVGFRAIESSWPCRRWSILVAGPLMLYQSLDAITKGTRSSSSWGMQAYRCLVAQPRALWWKASPPSRRAWTMAQVWTEQNGAWHTVWTTQRGSTVWPVAPAAARTRRRTERRPLQLNFVPGHRRGMTPARLFAAAHVAVVLAVLARAALSVVFTQLVVLAFVTTATASATAAEFVAVANALTALTASAAVRAAVAGATRALAATPAAQATAALAYAAESLATTKMGGQGVVSPPRGLCLPRGLWRCLPLLLLLLQLPAINGTVVAAAANAAIVGTAAAYGGATDASTAAPLLGAPPRTSAGREAPNLERAGATKRPRLTGAGDAAAQLGAAMDIELDVADSWVPIESLIGTHDTNITVPAFEMAWLLGTEGLEYWDEEFGAERGIPGPTVQPGAFYKDHDDKTQPGRLMLHLMRAIGCPTFQRRCPVLHETLSIHKRHGYGNFVVMITWGRVLCHNDLKALKSGETDVEGFGRYKAGKLAGPGAIDDDLYLHTIGGDDSVLDYTQREGKNTNKTSLGGSKWRATAEEVVHTVRRRAGCIQFVRAWLHAAQATSKKDKDGKVYVRKLNFGKDEREDRVFHTVAPDPTGKLGATVSILGKISRDNQANLVSALGDSERARRARKQRDGQPNEGELPNEPGLTFLRAGGVFYDSVMSLFRETNTSNGMGGKSVEEHAAAIQEGFEAAADAKGLEFVHGQHGEGGPGSALVHDGHDRAAAKKDLPFAPGVRGKGGSGSALTIDALKKKGKDKAAPEAIALKAKVKCKLLDALGQPGWGFKSYPRGDGTSTNVLFRHLVLTGKPISFAAAQKVAARG